MGAGKSKLSINQKTLCNGKEDSYERNPGGVSFVLNHKFFELEKFKKLASLQLQKIIAIETAEQEKLDKKAKKSQTSE